MSTSTAYGWVITWTTFEDEKPGICGPRNSIYNSGKIIAEGREFRMLDDDGEHYYTGFYLGPHDGTEFGPLDDFGTPNAGATSIEYRNAAGHWEAL